MWLMSTSYPNKNSNVSLCNQQAFRADRVAKIKTQAGKGQPSAEKMSYFTLSMAAKGKEVSSSILEGKPLSSA